MTGFERSTTHPAPKPKNKPCWLIAKYRSTLPLCGFLHPALSNLSGRSNVFPLWQRTYRAAFLTTIMTATGAIHLVEGNMAFPGSPIALILTTDITTVWKTRGSKQVWLYLLNVLSFLKIYLAEEGEREPSIFHIFILFFQAHTGIHMHESFFSFFLTLGQARRID